MAKLRALAINLALLIGSVVVFAAFCEFVVFRFVWPASDAPRLDYVNDVVRYAPHQQGVWRVRDEIAAHYRINGQGWNSGVGDYALDRHPGAMRVAIVGDSFVEAMQVASTDSVAEILARTLTAVGQPAEVYRFGISGAPLSQYVQMVEREVGRYRPDWIVVIVVHNDFDESYKFKQGRYTSSFMKFRVEGGRVTGEVSPAPWHASAIEGLRETATARFLFYRWQFRPQLIVDLLMPAKSGSIAANVDVGSILQERSAVAAVADHAVQRLDALSKSIGARLLLAMDGDRRAIYRGQAGSPALELNRILEAAAGRQGVGFLDLHPIFAAHWAAHHRRLGFDADGHWNEIGHSVAAAAIAERIRDPR